MVEREHPLELDLLTLGLDLLPECLQRWLKAKVMLSTEGVRGRAGLEGDLRKLHAVVPLLLAAVWNLIGCVGVAAGSV